MKNVFTMGVITIMLAMFSFTGCYDDPLDLGEITTMDRNSNYMLAAPHGGYDYLTEDIVGDVCKAVSWDCIIATGYRDSSYNVNRPTGGTTTEVPSENATIIFEEYRSNVEDIMGNPFNLYMEIHGYGTQFEKGNISATPCNRAHDADKPCIEVALAGIGDDTRNALKAIFEEELENANIDNYVLMEGDPVYNIIFSMGEAKRTGIMNTTDKSISPVNHAIGIEFPRKLRNDNFYGIKTALKNILARIENEVTF